MNAAYDKHIRDKNLTIKQWKIFLMIFRTLLMNEYFIFLFTHTLKAEKRRK